MSDVWFIAGATRGMGAEIAKAALAAGNKVMAIAILEKPDGKTGNCMKQVSSGQYNA